MKIFALTGGIATGKTTVGDMLVALGAYRIDADRIVHTLYDTDPLMCAKIRDRFGADVLRADGGVDRERLAQRVMHDTVARRALEALVHPAVTTVMLQQQADATQQGVGFCCWDVPLLFETGMDARFATIIVTACDAATQVRRVMARYGCDATMAHARIAMQWPLDEKIARATHVIRTDASLEATRRAVEKVFAQL